MPRRHAVAALALALGGCAAQPSAPAPPDRATVRVGEVASLGGVYWVNTAAGCASQLVAVRSVELASGAEYVALTVVPQRVRTWQCGNTVDGAVISARGLRATGDAPVNVEYLVAYDTVVGPRTSRHVRQVTVTP